MPDSSHIARTTCPYCGYVCTHATPAMEAETPPPRAGDISICLECGQFSLFEAEPLRLRLPEPEEVAEIEEDRDCRAAREAWLRTLPGQRSLRQFHRLPAGRA